MRIRTIRSTWWLTVLTVVLGTGLALLYAWDASRLLERGQGLSRGEMEILAPMIVSHYSGAGAPFLPPYLLAMVGVFAWGHEYRHGMIRATLTALSSRTHTWMAKYVVVGLWVVVVTTVTLLLSALMGWVWLRDNGVSFATYNVGSTLVKAVGYTLVFTVVATALTALIRQQTAALVLMFLWPLVIEDIITLVLQQVPGLTDLAPLARFLPYSAGRQMLSVRDVTGAMFGEPLTPWAGFIVFAGFAALLMVLTLELFKKRDA